MFEHEWDQKSVDFPLTKASLVLDIGGYKGRWAKEIAQRYGARICVFEPQPWAREIAVLELKEFSNVVVYDHGLGVESGKFEMEEFETDGATFMLGRSQRQQSGEGYIIEMMDWLTVNHIESIDLVMMNIEGYEFKLIPYMIEKGIMQRVKFFMCQFHLKDWTEEESYLAIRKQLGEFMDVYWDYGQVLTCWMGKERLSAVGGQQATQNGASSAATPSTAAPPLSAKTPARPVRKSRKKDG